MISTENLSALTTAGGNVIGSDGSKIGSIGQIYADDRTLRTDLRHAGCCYLPTAGRVLHLQAGLSAGRLAWEVTSPGGFLGQGARWMDRVS